MRHKQRFVLEKILILYLNIIICKISSTISSVCLAFSHLLLLMMIYDILLIRFLHHLCLLIRFSDI